MKRWISLLLALSLLCTLLTGLSLPVSAEVQTGSFENITWEFENGVLTLRGEGPMPVTEGRLYQFSEANTVIVDNGITTISEGAFGSFYELERIQLPDTLTEIGASAFSNCTKLESISVPESVQRIGEYAFRHCTSLQSVYLPRKMDKINDGAFMECYQLSLIEMPDYMNTLENMVFYYCHSLTSLTIPEGIWAIPIHLCYECHKLTSVTFPTSLLRISPCAFASNTVLSDVVIPASVKSIGYNAFNRVNGSITLLNHDCDIGDDFIEYKNSSLIVRGYYGSTAFDYAQNQHLQFEPLDGCELGYHAFTEEPECTIAPTCQSEGELTYTCIYCGITKTEAVDKLPHSGSMVQVLQEPTYLDEGIGLFLCDTCGNTYEEKIDRLYPGEQFTQVLYDRDDWSGAYILGGFDYLQMNDGSIKVTSFTHTLFINGFHSQQTGVFPRYGIYSITGAFPPDYLVLVRQPDGSYYICDFETHRYLCNKGNKLVDAAQPDDSAKWNVYVENGGLAISSCTSPNYRILYNYIDRQIQLLNTYTYGGKTYNASDIFGIWLLEPDPCAYFLDVDPLAWYHPGIDFAVANELFNGMSADRFGVNESMTRSMFVTVLWRMQGKPAAADAKDFEDVPAGTWYSDAVAWASSEGIVNGTSATTFSPDAAITREQMAVLMYRYARWLGLDVSGGTSLNAYPDVGKVSGFATDGLSWAVGRGIITGATSGSSVVLSPQGKASRAQVATILMRFVLAYLPEE